MARFDCAVWRPVANHGGALRANIGLLLHHAVATGSLYTWFNNPSSGVSAHFWVALDGTIEQYVDTDLTAWHAMDLNDTYIGVETEGCVAPPHDQPMSPAMVDALARLYAEGHQRHGWPFVLADADGYHGFGYHRMGVATACPCQVRVDMRAEILTRAGELLDYPLKPDLEEDNNMVAVDPETGGVWVADRSGAVYSYDRAEYLGAVNNDKVNPQGFPCVGIDSIPGGYVLVLDFGAGADGDRFRRYRFTK